MKPIAKKIKINQPLAEALYATGNYDAMYFAGIIADPKAMTESDFDRWMDAAYFYMLSNFVVAVTLSESDIAQEVADKWIASGEELRMSAKFGVATVGFQEIDKTLNLQKARFPLSLDLVKNTIHDSPERTKSAMNNFLYTVGLSYLPLHEKAVETAKALGPVEVKRDKKKAVS